MNKTAFFEGYLCKEAGAFSDLLVKGIQYPGLMIAAPAAGSYYTGKLVGKLEEPAEEEVSSIQAAYVRRKLEQAIEDLERKKLLEQLRREKGARAASIRI